MSRDVVLGSWSWSRGASRTNFFGLGLGLGLGTCGLGLGLEKSPCLHPWFFESIFQTSNRSDRTDRIV